MCELTRHDELQQIGSREQVLDDQLEIALMHDILAFEQRAFEAIFSAETLRLKGIQRGDDFAR
jgi:hypothetical protein